MGRLDVRKKDTDQADESLFDNLEELDFDELPDIEQELRSSQQRCGTKDQPAVKSSRRRVEERLEELRLQRELAVLDDRLH